MLAQPTAGPNKHGMKGPHEVVQLGGMAEHGISLVEQCPKPAHTAQTEGAPKQAASAAAVRQ